MDDQTSNKKVEKLLGIGGTHKIPYGEPFIISKREIGWWTFSIEIKEGESVICVVKRKVFAVGIDYAIRYKNYLYKLRADDKLFIDLKDRTRFKYYPPPVTFEMNLSD